VLVALETILREVGFTTISTKIVFQRVMQLLYLPRSFCVRWFHCYTYRERCVGGGFTALHIEIVLWEVVSLLYLPRSFCWRWFHCCTYRDRFVGGGYTAIPTEIVLWEVVSLLCCRCPLLCSLSSHSFLCSFVEWVDFVLNYVLKIDIKRIVFKGILSTILLKNFHYP